MTLDGEAEFLGRHADTVIDDRDARTSAVGHRHVDAPGMRIDGVLDEFLDGSAGPLDHFTGCDAADERFRKASKVMRIENAGVWGSWRTAFGPSGRIPTTAGTVMYGPAGTEETKRSAVVPDVRRIADDDDRKVYATQ